jgi:hypothetical protein
MEAIYRNIFRESKDLVLVGHLQQFWHVNWKRYLVQGAEMFQMTDLL